MNILIFGTDELLIDERISALRQQLDPQGFSSTSIDVQSSSPADIASATQAVPFFGGQRVVVLRQPIAMPRRGAEANSDAEAAEESSGRIPWGDLRPLLNASPPTTTILLRHIGTLSPGHFVRKAVKSMGWREEAYAVPYGAELRAWVTDRVRTQGSEIQPQAAELLLNLLYPGDWLRVGGKNAGPTPDTRLIASEIDKLVTATNGVIDVELVNLLVEDRGGFTAYRLTDLVFAGRVEDALQELQRMLDAGEPAEKILAGLASEAIVKSILHHRRDIGEDALATAAAITPGRIRVAVKKAATSDAANKRVANLLRDADAAIKSGHETASTIVVPLVAQIAEAIRMSAGPRRRAS